MYFLQRGVSAYQRQDIIRIRQENYQRQHQKVNAQDEEELLRKENEEKLIKNNHISYNEIKKGGLLIYDYI